MIDLDENSVSLELNVSVKTLLDQMIEDLEDEELHEVIKYLDHELADTEFTKKMYEYFKDQKEADDEEEEIINENYDVTTTLSIIKTIINTSNKNKEVIDGILEFIQEIRDNA